MQLTDMHIWFRQYAQQMGMQNVRAILPEQIDLMINTSIDDTVNQIIKENIGVTNDRILSDNSKIGQINALSSLYTVVELDCFLTPQFITSEDLSAISNVSKDSVYYIIDKDIVLKVKNNIAGSTLVQNINNNITTNYTEPVSLFEFDSKNAYIGKITGRNVIGDYLYLVDFSLNYVKGDKLRGLFGETSKNKINSDNIGFITNYYPVRLIDDSYLADSLNDFVLKPRFRSPILTIYSLNKTSIFDLYIDKFIEEDGSFYLPNKLLPNKFRIAYIAKPQHVRYSEDADVPNIECNLPDYLHVDILKHAVDLYRLAVGGQPQQQQTPSNQ